MGKEVVIASFYSLSSSCSVSTESGRPEGMWWCAVHPFQTEPCNKSPCVLFRSPQSIWVLSPFPLCSKAYSSPLSCPSPTIWLATDAVLTVLGAQKVSKPILTTAAGLRTGWIQLGIATVEAVDVGGVVGSSTMSMPPEADVWKGNTPPFTADSTVTVPR